MTVIDPHNPSLARDVDTIILVRHGKPALSRKVRLTWQGYRDWWGQYDLGGLKSEQKIPKKVRRVAKTADIVISSPLPRAVESAELLTGKAPDKIIPELVEAALPSPHLGPLKFRPKTWGTWSRIVWYVGYAGGMENHRDARKRVEGVCDALADEAQGGKIVLVTAHGWINRMIKGSLMKRGWKCVHQNGDLHWSFRTLTRKTKT
ncbi:histidine phosphatase family protein [Fretibacter rubidus]|uniref:histidine phosphatase family protein n=1 Tax=Fretibacter rubidus TaxID=570162 RepID=UPI00352B29F4